MEGNQRMRMSVPFQTYPNSFNSSTAIVIRGNQDMYYSPAKQTTLSMWIYPCSKSLSHSMILLIQDSSKNDDHCHSTLGNVIPNILSQQRKHERPWWFPTKIPWRQHNKHEPRGPALCRSWGRSTTDGQHGIIWDNMGEYEVYGMVWDNIVHCGMMWYIGD